MRPRDENYITGIDRNKSMIIEDLKGFKRPFVDTKENIFPSENPKKEIKVKRKEKILKRRKIFTKYYGDKVGEIISPNGNTSYMEKKLPSKPCNNDYSSISLEARKNAHLRYYFENNASQWGF